MNDKIFFFFYNMTHWSTFFDKVVIFLAEYFPILVIFSAILFLFLRNPIFFKRITPLEFIKKWKEPILVFCSSILAYILSYVLKYFFNTPRPFFYFETVASLFSASGYAFPSGHATVFTALAFAIYFINKKVGYVFMCSAFLIGVARIASGVHFPIDILGGFILGGLISYIVKFVYEKFFETKSISPQS